MEKSDIDLFTAQEQRILDGGFDREALPGRLATILLSATAATVLVLLLLAFDASRTTIAMTFLAYVALVTLEKATYARGAFLARAVIRKLVRRVERLEGVPQTPDFGTPTQSTTTSKSEAA